jgi:predicted ATPase
VRVSRQLYGRARETATLLDKAKSAQGGKPGMLLIKGPTGVGKSTLLGQLSEFVRKEHGRFGSGKFDQYKRNVPYVALIQALQQLIGQRLSGTKAELEAWRSRILAAVGNNAKVVIDIIPPARSRLFPTCRRFRHATASTMCLRTCFAPLRVTSCCAW